MRDRSAVAFEYHLRCGAHDWGEVTAWEPGRRLVHTFSLAQNPTAPGEVAVEFVSDGDGTSTVRFAHGTKFAPLPFAPVTRTTCPYWLRARRGR